MYHSPRFFGVLLLVALSACGGQVDRIDSRLTEAAPPGSGKDAAPPGAPPGSCWGRHVTPAVIETVSEQVLARPTALQPDGTVARPASYRTETTHKILRERKENWFETPCPADLTPQFIASLQRALAVRGLYHGPITADMNARTRAAIRRYQAPMGLDTGILSLAAARKLGLVAVAPPGE